MGKEGEERKERRGEEGEGRRRGKAGDGEGGEERRGEGVETKESAGVKGEGRQEMEKEGRKESQVRGVEEAVEEKGKDRKESRCWHQCMSQFIHTSIWWPNVPPTLAQRHFTSLFAGFFVRKSLNPDSDRHVQFHTAAACLTQNDDEGGQRRAAECLGYSTSPSSRYNSIFCHLTDEFECFNNCHKLSTSTEENSEDDDVGPL